MIGTKTDLDMMALYFHRDLFMTTITGKTIVAILLPILLFCGGIIYAAADTQGVLRYVIAAAQRGDVRGTREQLLIQSGLNATVDRTQQLIQRGTNVNARDVDANFSREIIPAICPDAETLAAPR